jgi:hypothetical protein
MIDVLNYVSFEPIPFLVYDFPVMTLFHIDSMSPQRTQNSHKLRNSRIAPNLHVYHSPT